MTSSIDKVVVGVGVNERLVVLERLEGEKTEVKGVGKRNIFMLKL